MSLSLKKHRFYETCKLYFILCFGFNNSLLSNHRTYPDVNFSANLDLIRTMDILVHRFNEIHPLHYNETVHAILRQNDDGSKYVLGHNIAKKIILTYDNQKIKNCISRVLTCLLNQENQLEFERTADSYQINDVYDDDNTSELYPDYPNLDNGNIGDFSSTEY
ncbi:Hypothetical protein CINCED_3A007931 [Cinara cedri]|uniref:Uncharacterized protein n=1 Tax=Cinara cedri TaxID=506608 RepID=A0A5E4N5D4_9HEMI|nr:Hypothetical protein CINCED_3A007931 [Cinara cedri]